MTIGGLTWDTAATITLGTISDPTPPGVVAAVDANTSYPYYSRWWTFTPATTGFVQLDDELTTINPGNWDYATDVALWQGVPGAGGQIIRWADYTGDMGQFGHITTQVMAGVTYYVQVGTQGSTALDQAAVTTFVLRTTDPTLPEPGRTTGAAAIQDHTYTVDSGSTSTVVALPTCTTGDELVLIVGANMPSGYANTPSGWTQLVSHSTSSNGASCRIFRKKATAADATPGATVTLSFTGSSRREIVAISAPTGSWTAERSAYNRTSTPNAELSTSTSFDVGEDDILCVFIYANTPTAGTAGSSHGELVESHSDTTSCSGLWIGKYADYQTGVIGLHIPASSGYAWTVVSVWTPKYGEWQQGPEFTGVAGSNVANTMDQWAGDSTTIYQPGPPADNAVIQSLIASSDWNWTGSPGPSGPVGVTGLLKVTYDHTAGGFPDARMMYGVIRNNGLMVFDPRNASMTNFPYPTTPPDSIGYEWEPGGAVTATAGTISGSYTNRNRDSSNALGPVPGSWVTRFYSTSGVTTTLQNGAYEATDWTRVIGPHFLEVSDTTDGTTGSYTVDISNYLFDGGKFAFTTDVVGSVSFTSLNTYEASIGVGAMYSGLATISYTLLPPRHRFKYRWIAPSTATNVGQLYVNLSTDYNNPNWVSVCPDGYFNLTTDVLAPTFSEQVHLNNIWVNISTDPPDWWTCCSHTP